MIKVRDLHKYYGDHHLNNGDIVEVGPPDEIFTNPRSERTRTFLGRVLK